MSKTSELSAMIDNLISCGETLAETRQSFEGILFRNRRSNPGKA